MTNYCVCFCIVYANVHLRNKNISSVFAFLLDGSLQVAPMAVCFSIVFVDVPLRTKDV